MRVGRRSRQNNLCEAERLAQREPSHSVNPSLNASLPPFLLKSMIQTFTNGYFCQPKNHI